MFSCFLMFCSSMYYFSSLDLTMKQFKSKPMTGDCSTRVSLSPRVFLGFLGFGLAIMFCTSFFRACGRIRDDQIQRQAQQRREQESHLRSIYFIPFPRSLSQQDSEDPPTPPRYSTSGYMESPPSYNEVSRMVRTRH